MIPALNDKPKYDFVIPSTGKSVRFRPYLVKEEKTLLIAFGAEDRREGIKAIAETIEACSMGKLDPKELTLFDLQYLFTKIRSKSVGERVEIMMPCESCGVKNATSIDIDNVKFENTTDMRKKKLALNDEITIEMKYPNYMTILSNEKLFNDDVNSSEEMIELATDVIVSVLTPDTRIDMTEESRDDRIAFVESMNPEQFSEVKKFIETEPSVAFEIDFDCAECSNHNHYTIRNFKDFF